MIDKMNKCDIIYIGEYSDLKRDWITMKIQNIILNRTEQNRI